MNQIKVLIVDDDPDWLLVMRDFLADEPDISVIKTAVNEAEAWRIIETFPIDIILMDINLTGNQHEGLYIAAEISRSKNIKIIMLTTLTEEEVIKDSFTAGAVNYVTKNNYREIPSLIRSSLQNPLAMEVLLKEYSRLKKEEQLKGLTPAEKEVYELVEQGYTQAQIREMLYKSESTLKNQINRILKKLQVKKSKDAVRKVQQKGLIQTQGPGVESVNDK